MITWYVWPCGTVCPEEELEEFLTFMSDDYVTCTTSDEDIDCVPDYDEIVVAKGLWNGAAVSDS